MTLLSLKQFSYLVGYTSKAFRFINITELDVKYEK